MCCCESLLFLPVLLWVLSRSPAIHSRRSFSLNTSLRRFWSLRTGIVPLLTIAYMVDLLYPVTSIASSVPPTRLPRLLDIRRRSTFSLRSSILRCRSLIVSSMLVIVSYPCLKVVLHVQLQSVVSPPRIHHTRGSIRVHLFDSIFRLPLLIEP